MIRQMCNVAIREAGPRGAKLGGKRFGEVQPPARLGIRTRGAGEYGDDFWLSKTAAPTSVWT
jgi:hypothetical protein